MSSQILVESLPSHNSSGSAFQPMWNEDGAQIILVLVGLIASGKSTFAQALETHVPQFRRCNQDDLGNRAKVERLARKSLDEGLSVCIDRTNFDHDQRRHWISIARDYPRCKVWCIIFDTPTSICRERLLHRSDHPTIRSPEQGIAVLSRFQKMLVLPTGEEGFERIFRLNHESHPSPHYTPEDTLDILTRVSNAIPSLVTRQSRQRTLNDYFNKDTTDMRRNDNLNNNGAGRGFSGSPRRGYRRGNQVFRPQRGTLGSGRGSGFVHPSQGVFGSARVAVNQLQAGRGYGGSFGKQYSNGRDSEPESWRRVTVHNSGGCVSREPVVSPPQSSANNDQGPAELLQNEGKR